MCHKSSWSRFVQGEDHPDDALRSHLALIFWGIFYSRMKSHYLLCSLCNSQQAPCCVKYCRQVIQNPTSFCTVLLKLWTFPVGQHSIYAEARRKVIAGRHFSSRTAPGLAKHEDGQGARCGVYVSDRSGGQQLQAAASA